MNFEQWQENNYIGLKEAFLEKVCQDFAHWCMMSRREFDCPDSEEDYVETNVKEFNNFCKEKYEEL